MIQVKDALNSGYSGVNVAIHVVTSWATHLLGGRGGSGGRTSRRWLLTSLEIIQRMEGPTAAKSCCSADCGVFRAESYRKRSQVLYFLVPRFTSKSSACSIGVVWGCRGSAEVQVRCGLSRPAVSAPAARVTCPLPSSFFTLLPTFFLTTTSPQHPLLLHQTCEQSVTARTCTICFADLRL